MSAGFGGALDELLGAPAAGVARFVVIHRAQRSFRWAVLGEAALALGLGCCALPVLAVLVALGAAAGAVPLPDLDDLLARAWRWTREIEVQRRGADGAVLHRAVVQPAGRTAADALHRALLEHAAARGLVVLEAMDTPGREPVAAWYGGQPWMQAPVTPDLPACTRILARTGRVEDGAEGVRVALAERRPAAWLAAFGVVVLAPVLCWTAGGRETLRELWDDARGHVAELHVELSRATLRFARVRGPALLTGGAPGVAPEASVRWEDTVARGAILGVAFAPGLGFGAEPGREAALLRVHLRGRSLHVAVPGGEATGPALLTILAAASARLDGAVGSPPRIAACPWCATRYAFVPGARCPSCGAPPVQLEGLLEGVISAGGSRA